MLAKFKNSKRLQMVLISALFLGLFFFIRSLPVQSCNIAHYGDYLTADGSLGYCGDEDIHFFDLDQLTYPFTVELEPQGDLVSGQPVEFYFILKGPEGRGVGPDELIISHTERIHLLLVSDDLADYQHVHPEPTDVFGQYRFEMTPRQSGEYRAYFDFIVVASLRRALVDERFNVSGAELAASQPAGARLSVVQDGRRFSLITESIDFHPSETIRFELEVIDLATGDATPLQEVMGALAHLVAFDASRNGFAHMHPLLPYQSDVAAPSKIPFAFNAVREGHFRIWAQVRIDGADVFVPFDLPVRG
ncbi:MAG: hypothetical protein ACI81V_001101 [Lentimonas sp.]|jgi:hypothetical protein